MKLKQTIFTALCFVSLLLIPGTTVAAETVTTLSTTGTASFEVISISTDPSEPIEGNEVTVKATIRNTGNAEGIYYAELMINGEFNSSQSISIQQGQVQTGYLYFTPSKTGTYTLSVGNKSISINVSEAKFREGPVVTLRPVVDEISSSADGLVEVFISNPSLNDVTLHGDMYISVPSGIYVYGEGFGESTAAGTVYGEFSIPSGTARTIYINIKADESVVGETFFIHFSGEYWPGDDKDSYNPISLTHPFTVVAASPDPTDSSLTDPDQIDDNNGGGGVSWWGWGKWIVIAVIVVIGLAVVVPAIAKKSEVHIEK
jgi:hypothetical protein